MGARQPQCESGPVVVVHSSRWAEVEYHLIGLGLSLTLKPPKPQQTREKMSLLMQNIVDDSHHYSRDIQLKCRPAHRPRWLPLADRYVTTFTVLIDKAPYR
jgi:hypothetical protein